MLTIDKPAAAYDELYKGNVILVKVSGEELASDDVGQLVADVQWLTQKGIRVVFIFGGGNQITQKYRDATGKERPMMEGVGVTDDEVLKKGVLPAYEDIRAKLAGLFPDAKILDPDAMPCHLHPDTRCGLVGIPDDVTLPEDSPLTIIGFIGKTSDMSRHAPDTLETVGPLLNVNADDIAVAYVKKYHDLINELIFITKIGGVLRTKTDSSMVPLLTDWRLKEKVLKGIDLEIDASGGMLKKLKAVLDVLEEVGKIAMTDAKGLRAEIEQWKGSGTLCIDTKQLRIGKIREIEKAIFRAIYEEYVRLGKFRDRSNDPKAMQALEENHIMLRSKNSPLGGASLIDQEGDWIEISTVWAWPIGNGLGQICLDKTLEHIQEERGGKRSYALAQDADARAAFRANEGFRSLGVVSEAKKKHLAELPPSVQKYDVPGRDPEVFLAVAV
jgi:acetylglutamate kinase